MTSGTWPACHISVSISRPPAAVYAFISNPVNLPGWASGLASSEVTSEGGVWFADAPFGRVKIRFVESNTLGVVDHDVELEDGQVFHNPMRVVPNNEGSEVVFTLYRREGMSDAEFERDRKTIEKDLAALKRLLEE
jgi:carbon monoxide dehydrogenase subunit G